MTANPAVAAWLEQNPGWTGWLTAQEELWQQAHDMHQQGYTLAQACAALGAYPPPPEPELPKNLTDLPKALQDKLIAQARDQARAGLRVDQLPTSTRQALLAQARRQLKRG